MPRNLYCRKGLYAVPVQGWWIAAIASHISAVFILVQQKIRFLSFRLTWLQICLQLAYFRDSTFLPTRLSNSATALLCHGKKRCSGKGVRIAMFSAITTSVIAYMLNTHLECSFGDSVSFGVLLISICQTTFASFLPQQNYTVSL